MRKPENPNRLAPEQYRSQKSKAEDIQDTNNRLFYYLIRKKRTLTMIIFEELVYKYELVVHSISSLSLQRVVVPKEPILCTFTTIQNTTHLARTAFGESTTKYGGDN